MASKRIKNRMYWAVVKATADGSTYAPVAYQDLLIYNHTDRNILPYLESLESVYGTHSIHVDLANADLWTARRTIDAIRKNA